MSFVLIATFGIQTRIRPWRAEIANFADSASLMGLQMLLTVGGLVVGASEDAVEVESIVGAVTAVLFIAVAVLFVIAILVSLSMCPSGAYMCHRGRLGWPGTSGLGPLMCACAPVLP